MPDGAPRVAKLKPPSALAWRAIHLAAFRTAALWRERPAALSARIANAVVFTRPSNAPLRDCRAVTRLVRSAGTLPAGGRASIVRPRAPVAPPGGGFP